MNTYSYLWEAIQGFLEDDIPVLATHHSEHMKMVKQGGYTYISELTALEMEAAENCNLVIMKEKIIPTYQSTGTQNNSVYRDLFSEQ